MDVADLIRLHEGQKLQAYDDATDHFLTPGYQLKGHPTIGIGRALDTHGISAAEAENLFQADLQLAQAEAAGSLGFDNWNALDEVRQAALTDMAFDLGEGGLDGFKNMLAAIRASDWQRAHDECLARRGQVGPRENSDAKMLLTGQWPETAAA